MLTNWNGSGVTRRGLRNCSRNSAAITYPPPLPRTSSTRPSGGSTESTPGDLVEERVDVLVLHVEGEDPQVPERAARGVHDPRLELVGAVGRDGPGRERRVDAGLRALSLAAFAPFAPLAAFGSFPGFIEAGANSRRFARRVSSVRRSMPTRWCAAARTPVGREGRVPGAVTSAPDSKTRHGTRVSWVAPSTL